MLLTLILVQLLHVSVEGFSPWRKPSRLPVHCMASSSKEPAIKVTTGKSLKLLESAQSGCILIAPEHEYNHFLMEQAVLLYEFEGIGENDEVVGDAKGVILERPVAFKVNEMVPDFDMFEENFMFTGGEDGGKSVVMIHGHPGLEGARQIGGGLFVGGVAAAKEAVANGEMASTDFKFFFNHVRLSSVDLKGMLGDGGWRAVTLPSKDAPRTVLHNGDSGLWGRLRFRLDRQAEN